MADSVYIMQQNCFSHPSQSSVHPLTQQENRDPVFGGSISLGRFMSESLDWGKWSSFSHNRHLEEVQKYSRPGSVAQKKAYFEAHYKRLAAQRAAALVEEQAGSQPNSVPEHVNDNGLQQRNAADSDIGAGASSGLNTVNATDEILEIESDRKAGGYADKPFEVESVVSNSGCLTETKGADSNGKTDGSRTSVATDAHPLTEEKVLIEALMQIPSEKKLGEKCTNQGEKPPLKERSAPSQHSSVTAKKKSTVSSANLSILNQVSNIVTSPAKSATPIHFRKENNATPSSKKSKGDSMVKNNSTPKSLHPSFNLLPYHAGEITPSMAKKPISPLIEKTRCSKKALSSSQIIRDSLNAANAPITVSSSRILRLPSGTPHLENRRRTPSSENMTFGIPKAERKWQMISLDSHSKPSSTSGSNMYSPLVSSGNRRSPIVSSPFNFRCDERAAKRKQKLEEKFNAKEETQRIQTKNKEIDGNELTKRWQSYHGFKARPMPDFHRKTELKNQIKKIPLTCPKSPKLGRRPKNGGIQEPSPGPSPSPLAKNGGSTHTPKTKTQTRNYSLVTLQTKNAHENTSPNIQC